MIVVPTAQGKLCPETVAALDESGYPYEIIYLEDDPDYYMKVFVALWNKIDDDLVIVEHDNVPYPGSIKELLECEHDWCANPYQYAHLGKWCGLGHTKFSKRLQKDVWNLPHGIANKEWGHPPMHWCTLDCHVTRLLTCFAGKYCLQRHEHPREVGHLGTGMGHDCVGRHLT